MRLTQQLLALIDPLATLPLLQTATTSASTASACDQALAQADGHAFAGNATDGPHLPLGPPPSPVMQVRERPALCRQLARGIVHAPLARPVTVAGFHYDEALAHPHGLPAWRASQSALRGHSGRGCGLSARGLVLDEVLQGVLGEAGVVDIATRLERRGRAHVQRQPSAFRLSVRILQGVDIAQPTFRGRILEHSGQLEKNLIWESCGVL